MLANPDDAWSVIGDALRGAQRSIDIYIYEITGSAFCGALADAASRGVSVRVLGSYRIDSQGAYYEAQHCYRLLAAAGAAVQRCARDIFEFEHEKFWVVDNRTLFLSSGNAGATDFPTGAAVFPPPGHAGYRRVNRDHTVVLEQPALVAAYKQLMDEDWKRGTPFQ